MAAKDGDAVVRLSVDAGPLAAGLSDAQGKVQSFASRAEGSFRTVSGGTGNLEQRVRSLKSEMASGDRTINFFARSLDSIVPASSAAGQGIRLLADGIIGGVGLGLALQGVMAAVELFGASLRERAEDAKKAAEAIGRLIDGTNALAAANANAARELSTGIKANIWEAYDRARVAADGLAEAEARLAAQAQHLAEVEALRFVNADEAGALSSEVARLDVLRAELAATTQLVEQLRARTAELQKAAGLAVAGGELPVKAPPKSSKKAEANPLLVDFKPDTDGVQNFNSQPPAFAGNIPGLGGVSEFERAAAGATGAAMNAEDAAKRIKDAEAFNQKLAVMNQKGALLGDTFSSMGTVIGSAFGEAAGNMTAMFGKLIQQAIQLAVAMSGSAGPLAPYQTAAALASIMATLASVPEMRAAGGSVSSGRPYIVGELGPELFIPGGSGTIVPNNKLGGGNTTIIIPAMDGASVRRTVEGAEFQRATRRAARQANRRGTV